MISCCVYGCVYTVYITYKQYIQCMCICVFYYLFSFFIFLSNQRCCHYQLWSSSYYVHGNEEGHDLLCFWIFYIMIIIQRGIRYQGHKKIVVNKSVQTHLIFYCLRDIFQHHHISELPHPLQYCILLTKLTQRHSPTHLLINFLPISNWSETHSTLGTFILLFCFSNFQLINCMCVETSLFVSVSWSVFLCVGHIKASLSSSWIRATALEWKTRAYVCGYM